MKKILDWLFITLIALAFFSAAFVEMESALSVAFIALIVAGIGNLCRKIKTEKAF